VATTDRRVAVKNLRDRARRARWREVLAGGVQSFALFCEHFIRITTRTPGEVIPFRWNRIQRRFVARRLGWDIVLKARQVGLTTLELARDVWFALVTANVAVGVCVAPDRDQKPKKRTLATLGGFIERLVEWGLIDRPEWAGGVCTFANGSTLTVFDAGGTEQSAGKMGRGGTFHRLHVTELAFFPFAGKLLEALFAAVPEAEKGGEVTIESTAKGAGGSFYELWNGATAGTNGLRPHFFGWFLAPEYATGGDLGPAEPADDDEKELVEAARAEGVTLTVAQLTWWRRIKERTSLDTVLQEYPHNAVRCFLLSGEPYYDRKAIVALEKLVRLPLTRTELRAAADVPGNVQPYRRALARFEEMTNRGGVHLRVWYPPEPGNYVIPVDCAGGGTSGDWLVAPVLRRGDRRHMATLRARILPAQFARWCAALARAYGDAYIAPERNGHGGTVLHVLHEELHYPHIYRDEKGELGWWTGPSNRTPAIDDFGDALVAGEVHTHDSILTSECRTFVRTKSGKVEAEPGCHDDMVMSFVIGWKVLHAPRGPKRPAGLPEFGA